MISGALPAVRVYRIIVDSTGSSDGILKDPGCHLRASRGCWRSSNGSQKLLRWHSKGSKRLSQKILKDCESQLMVP